MNNVMRSRLCEPETVSAAVQSHQRKKTAYGGEAGSMSVDPHELEQEFAELLGQSGALRFLDRAAFDGLWLWDLERPGREWTSPSFWKTLGYQTRERPTDWRDLLLGEDRERLFEAFNRHADNILKPLDEVLHFTGADGSIVAMRCRGQAIRQNGRAARMIGVLTVQPVAAAAEHDRQLGELLELSTDAVFAWSLRGGVRRWNGGAVRLFGVSTHAAYGQNPNHLTGAVFPDGWDDVQAHLEAGLTWSGDVERIRADGTRIFTSARLSPVQIDDGDVLILEIDRDMTAQHAAHERLRLLNRELNHRVKNLFAVVQGLVAVSAQGEQDASVVTDKIQARISALAAAHLISIEEEDVRRVSFRRVLEAVLAPYDKGDKQLALRGVEAQLPRRAVTPVGMIFHELATNAVKYGALSSDEGRLDVTWMADDYGRGDPVLHVKWVERFDREDGEPNIKPGLGLPLIQQSARQLNGQLSRNWSADGMETCLSFSLSEKVGAPTVESTRPRTDALQGRADVN